MRFSGKCNSSISRPSTSLHAVLVLPKPKFPKNQHMKKMKKANGFIWKSTVLNSLLPLTKMISRIHVLGVCLCVRYIGDATSLKPINTALRPENKRNKTDALST